MKKPKNKKANWQEEQTSTRTEAVRAYANELRMRTNHTAELAKVDISTMTVDEAMAYQRKYQQALYRQQCLSSRMRGTDVMDYSHISIVQ
jgi:hypothetical protein